VPAACRGPLVGGRNLRQSVWSLALCLPGDRSVRTGHRRVCVPAAGSGRSPVFFTRALVTIKVVPVEVTTDKAAVYPRVVDELALWGSNIDCGLDLRVLGARGGSCCNLILADEPAEDGSAAGLMVGQVDHWWGLELGLGCCELSECPVWPCGAEVL
jgi:hypothetical protein